ncbi:MAG: hypothetical protein LBE79_12465 [Tannerella sp.]|nr:hypothetical protein [Tannerella sp.]
MVHKKILPFLDFLELENLCEIVKVRLGNHLKHPEFTALYSQKVKLYRKWLNSHGCSKKHSLPHSIAMRFGTAQKPAQVLTRL